MSTFTARYSAHSPSGNYNTNSLVTTGSGGALQIWRWTSSVSTTAAPATGNERGWIDVTSRYAAQQVDCDSADNTLASGTNISYDDADLAIVYNRQGNTDTVNSIVHTGAGGEIHVTDGSVSRSDNGGNTAIDAVSLSNAGTDTLRLVLSSGASVSNSDVTTGSDAIVVSGGGNVVLKIAGNTSSVGTALSATTTGASGNVNIDVEGGTHTVSGDGASVVSATAQGTSATGGIDIDITGTEASPTILVGGSGAAALVQMSGNAAGIDSLAVGANSVICRGTYNAQNGTCAPAGGTAIAFAKNSAGAGTITLTNSGFVVGDIFIDAASVGASITNASGGTIIGRIRTGTSASGSETVVNRGRLWTLFGRNTFAGGTDSLRNETELEIFYDGSTVVFSGLETFTNSGTLSFTLGSSSLPVDPLLDVGLANLTLGGSVDVFVRAPGTGSPQSLPNAGQIFLISGATLNSGTNLRNFSLDTDLTRDNSQAELRLARGKLILSLGDRCGAVASRTRQSPGRATRQITCDSADALASGNVISNFEDGVAIIYLGGTVANITNDGIGAEIHILSGSVAQPNDAAATAYELVHVGMSIAVNNIPTDQAILQNALSATRAESSLTAAQVFARDNTVRVITQAGTFVDNQDLTEGNIGITVQGAGGHVFMDIEGNTSVRGNNSRALYAITSASGNITVRIYEGIHTAVGDTASVVHAWLQPGVFTGSDANPRGTIDIDVTGNTRLGATGPTLTNNNTSVIYVDAQWDTSSSPPNAPADRMSTLDIGENAVLCRGVFDFSRNCIAQGDRYAILVRATGAQVVAGSRASVQITNEGKIFGGILSVDNPRGTRVVNQGSIQGSFDVGTNDGPDTIFNNGLWIMTKSSSFGVGSDSFTNRGTLVLRYKDTPVQMTGLETFTQASDALLRVEIDPRRAAATPALPSGAIVDFNGAQGNVEGRVEVILLDTRGLNGALAPGQLGALVTALGQNTKVQLFAGVGSLSLTALQLSGGLERDNSGTISYDLRAIPLRRPTQITGSASVMNVVVRPYDALVQASWFSTYGLWRFVGASGCGAEGIASGRAVDTMFLPTACGWANTGVRVFIHDTGDVEETALILTGGFQFELGEFFGHEMSLNTALSYEYGDMTFAGGGSDGSRVVVAFVLSGSGAEMPANFAAGITVNNGTYDLSRTDDGIAYTSDPEVLLVAGHGMGEYLVSLGGRATLVTKLQMDMTGVVMDGFSETNAGVQVGSLDAFLVSFTPAVELRRLDETPWGVFRSWLEVGVLVFATDPELEYEIGGRPSSGSMETALSQLSIGLTLVQERMEVGFFWDALLGSETFSNAVVAKGKFAF